MSQNQREASDSTGLDIETCNLGMLRDQQRHCLRREQVSCGLLAAACLFAVVGYGKFGYGGA